MLVRMSLTALGLPPAVISSTSPSLSPYGEDVQQAYVPFHFNLKVNYN